MILGEKRSGNIFTYDISEIIGVLLPASEGTLGENWKVQKTNSRIIWHLEIHFVSGVLSNE